MSTHLINFHNPTPEVIAFFKHINTLTKTPTIEELSLILPFVKHKYFKKGDSILKVGDISQEVYFNVKGMARSFYQLPNGTEKTYFIMIEQTIFSDYASLISQTPATENIEAIEDMEVYYIKQADLMYLFDHYHVWETLGRNISDANFIFSQKRLRSMMNDDATTKYTKFKKYYEKIAHRIPQNVVASYLGITPQSLSRLKKEMDIL